MESVLKKLKDRIPNEEFRGEQFFGFFKYDQSDTIEYFNEFKDNNQDLLILITQYKKNFLDDWKNDIKNSLSQNQLRFLENIIFEMLESDEEFVNFFKFVLNPDHVRKINKRLQEIKNEIDIIFTEIGDSAGWMQYNGIFSIRVALSGYAKFIIYNTRTSLNEYILMIKYGQQEIRNTYVKEKVPELKRLVEQSFPLRKESSIKEPNKCVIGHDNCPEFEQIKINYDEKNVFIAMLCSEREKLNLIKSVTEYFGLVPKFAEEEASSKEIMCKICGMIQTCKHAIVDKNTPSLSVIFEFGLMKGFGLNCMSIFDTRKEYYVGDEELKKKKEGTISMKDLTSLKFTDFSGMLHEVYSNDEELREKVGKLIMANCDEHDDSKVTGFNDYLKNSVISMEDEDI
ncbi:MAG: hypothetical protein EAX96_05715 [Candidatus Lokiarchaeota archaeon]|nr:hypothetical protein [Candidatus Lokiarchaeota archaeon]